MSNNLRPWLLDDATEYKRQHGHDLSDIRHGGKILQVVQFNNYRTVNSHGATVEADKNVDLWAYAHDKQLKILVRFDAEAVTRFEQNHDSFTAYKGGLFIVKEYQYCYATSYLESQPTSRTGSFVAEDDSHSNKSEKGKDKGKGVASTPDPQTSPGKKTTQASLQRAKSPRIILYVRDFKYLSSRGENNFAPHARSFDEAIGRAWCQEVGAERLKESTKRMKAGAGRKSALIVPSAHLADVIIQRTSASLGSTGISTGSVSSGIGHQLVQAQSDPSKSRSPPQLTDQNRQNVMKSATKDAAQGPPDAEAMELDFQGASAHTGESDQTVQPVPGGSMSSATATAAEPEGPSVPTTPKQDKHSVRLAPSASLPKAAASGEGLPRVPPPTKPPADFVHKESKSPKDAKPSQSVDANIGNTSIDEVFTQLEDEAIPQNSPDPPPPSSAGSTKMGEEQSTPRAEAQVQTAKASTTLLETDPGVQSIGVNTAKRARSSEDAATEPASTRRKLSNAQQCGSPRRSPRKVPAKLPRYSLDSEASPPPEVISAPSLPPMEDSTTIATTALARDKTPSGKDTPTAPLVAPIDVGSSPTVSTSETEKISKENLAESRHEDDSIQASSASTKEGLYVAHDKEANTDGNAHAVRKDRNVMSGRKQEDASSDPLDAALKQGDEAATAKSVNDPVDDEADEPDDGLEVVRIGRKSYKRHFVDPRPRKPLAVRAVRKNAPPLGPVRLSQQGSSPHDADDDLEMDVDEGQPNGAEKNEQQHAGTTAALGPSKGDVTITSDAPPKHESRLAQDKSNANDSVPQHAAGPAGIEKEAEPSIAHQGIDTTPQLQALSRKAFLSPPKDESSVANLQPEHKEQTQASPASKVAHDPGATATVAPDIQSPTVEQGNDDDPSDDDYEPAPIIDRKSRKKRVVVRPLPRKMLPTKGARKSAVAQGPLRRPHTYQPMTLVSTMKTGGDDGCLKDEAGPEGDDENAEKSVLEQQLPADNADRPDRESHTDRPTSGRKIEEFAAKAGSTGANNDVEMEVDTDEVRIRKEVSETVQSDRVVDDKLRDRTDTERRQDQPQSSPKIMDVWESDDERPAPPSPRNPSSPGTGSAEAGYESDDDFHFISLSEADVVEDLETGEHNKDLQGVDETPAFIDDGKAELSTASSAMAEKSTSFSTSEGEEVNVLRQLGLAREAEALSSAQKSGHQSRGRTRSASPSRAVKRSKVDPPLYTIPVPVSREDLDLWMADDDDEEQDRGATQTLPPLEPPASASTSSHSAIKSVPLSVYAALLAIGRKIMMGENASAHGAGPSVEGSSKSNSNKNAEEDVPTNPRSKFTSPATNDRSKSRFNTAGVTSSPGQEYSAAAKMAAKALQNRLQATLMAEYGLSRLEARGLWYCCSGDLQVARTIAAYSKTMHDGLLDDEIPHQSLSPDSMPDEVRAAYAKCWRPEEDALIDALGCIEDSDDPALLRDAARLKVKEAVIDAKRGQGSVKARRKFLTNDPVARHMAVGQPRYPYDEDPPNDI